ncbi:hypothetical protein A3D88_01490 [Candidatus Peribacteria bacterium RIFCSPHIGHO2_02_FULL_52_16]|nr:MAG: hypothetical protein A2706_03730 [Candidatus Peribacteria bacterium RIFCSPHIGHO2_01_FULL_51_35]OGJ60993.1 MAG: hypothetical protein A3D88_01490 [Candidatus Peribacteria bacterium RIFCSPHIGHO2_02_FULL_52_16]
MKQKELFRRVWNILPECIIASAALFFFVRELGTFPAAWNDDSLFMIVAREYATGNGYTLPILGRPWLYPILQVGPMLIYPSAFFMKILGPSIVAARIPMVLYLCGTTIVFYFFTKKIAGRSSACFATALLVSLSAFVNTGKVVIGEVPGMFFALIALLLLTQKRLSLWQSIACGAFVGAAFVTKLPYAFLLGGMGIAWIWALLQRKYPEVLSLTVAGFTTLLTFAIFSPVLGAMDMRFFVEIYAWIVGTDDILLAKHVLWTQPEFLLRLPFLAYDVVLILGIVGFIKLRRSMPNALSITIMTVIILFTAYCFTRSGWYRLLLAAHILLLPFVPTGARILFGKNMSIVVLGAIVLVQAWWQWDHRGSSASLTAQNTATYIQEHFADTNLIIQSAPVFIHLPKNPHWVFLTNVTLSTRIPAALVTPDEKQRCFTLIREKTPNDPKGGTLTGHIIVPPPKDCS